MESKQHFGSGDERYEAIQARIQSARAILTHNPNDNGALAELTAAEIDAQNYTAGFQTKAQEAFLKRMLHGR